MDLSKLLKVEPGQSDAMVAKLTKRVKEAYDLSQNRSSFAIDHFVVSQHDTPGKQRQQVLLELMALLEAILQARDSIDLALVDIDQADEVIKSLDANKFHKRREEIGKRSAQRTILGAEIRLKALLREAEHLLALLDKMPEYTLEMLEAEEPEYWSRRLSRQAVLNQRGNASGLGYGNLDAMFQFMSTPGENRNFLPFANPEVILSAFLPSDEPKNELPPAVPGGPTPPPAES